MTANPRSVDDIPTWSALAREDSGAHHISDLTSNEHLNIFIDFLAACRRSADQRRVIGHLPNASSTFSRLNHFLAFQNYPDLSHYHHPNICARLIILIYINTSLCHYSSWPQVYDNYILHLGTSFDRLRRHPICIGNLAFVICITDWDVLLGYNNTLKSSTRRLWAVTHLMQIAKLLELNTLLKVYDLLLTCLNSTSLCERPSSAKELERIIRDESLVKTEPPPSNWDPGKFTCPYGDKHVIPEDV